MRKRNVRLWALLLALCCLLPMTALAEGEETRPLVAWRWDAGEVLGSLQSGVDHTYHVVFSVGGSTVKAANASGEVTITVTNAKKQTVHTDTVPVADGKFAFTVNLPAGEYLYHLEYSGDENFRPCHVELEQVRVTGDAVITYAPGFLADKGQQAVRQTAAAGEAYAVAGALFTRKNYTLSGWSFEDGGDADYAVGASFPQNLSATLYPVWAVAEGVTPTEKVDPVPRVSDVGFDAGSHSFEIRLCYSGRATLAKGITGKAEVWFENGAGQATPRIRLTVREPYLRFTTTLPAGDYKLRIKYYGDAKFKAFNTRTNISVYGSTVVTYEPGSLADAGQQAVQVTRARNEESPAAGQIFARKDYVIAGWSLTDGGKLRYAAEGSLPKNLTVTLYPVWTARTGTVSFDTAGGTEIAPRTGVGLHDAVLAGVADPERSGYRFAGWSYQGQPVVRDATYASLEAGEALLEIRLTALWEPLAHITYDANGADAGSVPTDATEYAQGAAFTAAENTGGLARAGHVFAGWYYLDPETGAKVPVAAGAEAQFPADALELTLYAAWEALPTPPAKPEVPATGEGSALLCYMGLLLLGALCALGLRRRRA